MLGRVGRACAPNELKAIVAAPIFRDQTRTVLTDPVIAVIYGQAGLILGATLDGTRYTRILP